MVLQALIDLVVVIHLLFILFAVLGGLLGLRWPRLLWIHAPAVVWAALIEFVGWRCPLTPLENWLRGTSGGSVYPGGFIEHYLLRIIYPAGLTREVQLVFGALLLLVNLAIYLAVWRRRRHAGSVKR
jgi:hypothetical protein